MVKSPVSPRTGVVVLVTVLMVAGIVYFVSRSSESADDPRTAESARACDEDPPIEDGRVAPPEGLGLRINEVGSHYDPDTGIVSYGVRVINRGEWTAHKVVLGFSIVDQDCDLLDDEVQYLAPDGSGENGLPSRSSQVISVIDDGAIVGLGDRVRLSDVARRQTTMVSVRVSILDNDWLDPIKQPVPLALARWSQDFEKQSGNRVRYEVTLTPAGLIPDDISGSMVFYGKSGRIVGGTPLLRVQGGDGTAAIIDRDADNRLSVTGVLPPASAEVVVDRTRGYINAGHLDPATGTSTVWQPE